MSTFWSLWIIVLTTVNLILLLWVLLANRKVAVKDDDAPENVTTGHVYDGIEEYDNPLPKWWFMLFIGTFIFTVIYLILYPGYGSFKGVLGWTSTNQLERQQEKAQVQYQDSYGVFSQMPVKELALEPRAMKMAQRIFANNCHDAVKAEVGQRLFAQNCAACHGGDGKGNQALGAPNLTDNIWLYDGSPAGIRQTLRVGRNGVMPAQADRLREEKIHLLTAYVYSLSLDDQ